VANHEHLGSFEEAASRPAQIPVEVTVRFDEIWFDGVRLDGSWIHARSHAAFDAPA
jgi:hypothetical protein